MIFSVVIATFNSESILPRVLKSIRMQNFPQDQIEILLIDGLSIDNTRRIASEFNARFIDNPYVDPVNAKYLGYQNAKGQFIIYLDHDEVIDNPNSFQNKKDIFEKKPDIVAIITSGYRNPPGYPFLNQYINDFGDPFSAFFYNLSKDYRYFLQTMKNRFQVSDENEKFVEFAFTSDNSLPLIELCAAGACLRKSFFDHFSWTMLDIPHLFYLMLKNQGLLAIGKNDSLTHYSSEAFSKYKNKIKWRIRNNIFFLDSLGQAGFSGREQQTGIWHKLKAYLFVPYVGLLLPCLLHSLYFCIQRRNMKYLFHLFASFYTLLWILTYHVGKVCGYRPVLRSYDGKAKIRS